jgi:hypothetical protein
VQVADRFHLLQNLAEALETAFSAQAAELRALDSANPDPTFNLESDTLPEGPDRGGAV